MKTPEGKLVFGGMFKMYDQHGLPIEIQLELCKDKNLEPGFWHFMVDALKHGWGHKTIFSTLEHPVIDIYGRNAWEEIKKTMVFCMTKQVYLERKNYET